MSKKPFTWIEQMSCVYHDKINGEGGGRVKAI